MISLVVTLSIAAGLTFGSAGFDSAKPIWPDGRANEKNLSVGFRAAFEALEGERLVLRVAASSLYRASVNGEFVGHGPARGPHEYFRVDEWDLTARLVPGENLVAIEVAGYNANRSYHPDRPSFVQAEVVTGANALTSTAGDRACGRIWQREKRALFS